MRFVALFALLLVACKEKPLPPVPPDLAWPRVHGLGVYHRPITCADGGDFDDGLRLYYAFDVEAAEAAFRRAASTPCAIAEWGVALALGPNINTPQLPERRAAAHGAILRALAIPTTSPVERALVEALAVRYEGTDIAASDRAYADRMRAVRKQYPNDSDVQALAAESLLDLHPFAQWTPDGKPAADTPELVELLETARARDPAHPGLMHYYIHAMESSPAPARALEAARTIGTLMPSQGHLVHMPSHIFLRVGLYQEAADWNKKAIAVTAETTHGPLYEMYVLHNHHFLWMALLWIDRESEALRQAELLAAHATPQMVASMPGMETLLTLPVLTRERFADWQGLLAYPIIPPSQPYAHAVQAALRVMAEARLDLARPAHLAELERFVLTIPKDRSMGANDARDVLAIAVDEARAEVDFDTKGHAEAGLAALRRAVVAEDALRYDEPPSWPVPARELLGPRLVAAGHLDEARAVFEADLKRHPNNRWAAQGLKSVAAHERKR
ncbi:MAG: hypothetical protein ABI321_14655 [Polyangia bacterium]